MVGTGVGVCEQVPVTQKREAFRLPPPARPMMHLPAADAGVGVMAHATPGVAVVLEQAAKKETR